MPEGQATIGANWYKSLANPTVQTAITIALDTRFLFGQPPGYNSHGIYMFDNRLTNGSKGQGQLELHTFCNNGDIISFEAVAINGLSGTKDTAEITGFKVSEGDVFGGSEGAPIPAELKAPPGSYWLAQAINAGTQTYQIYVTITQHGLHGASRDIVWDPYITSK